MVILLVYKFNKLLIMNPFKVNQSSLLPSISSTKEEKKEDVNQLKVKNASKILDQPPQNGQNLNKRELSSIKTEKKDLTETAKKAAEKEKKTAGWFYRNAPTAVLQAFAKAGEKILFNLGALKRARKDNLEQLEEFTQSAELPLFLGAISPVIVKVIQENTTDDEKLKSILIGEGKFLTDLIDALLPKILVNIIKSRNEKPPVSVATVIAFLIGIMNKHFDKIHSSIAQIENEDPIKKREALLQLFAPLIEELLRTGLPNGEKDLPLIPGAREYVWNYLKNDLFPDVLLNLYHSFMDPRTHSKMDQLRQMKGGDLLAHLCEAIGDKISDLGPQILTDQAEGISDMITSQFPKVDELPTALQADLQKRILNTKEQTATHENLKDEWGGLTADLHSWLEGQIIQVGQYQDPALQSLWKFIGDGIKPILAHLLLNLAEGSEGEDIFHTALKKLMTCIGGFIEENSKQIFEDYTRLQEKGIDPVKNKNFIRLFQPLSTKIFQMVGMDHEDDRPTPGILSKTFWADIENKYLPQLLIQMYISTSSWQNQAEKYRAEIKGITHTNHIPESCRILAQWVGDFLPSNIAVGSNAMAESIYGFVQKHLTGTSNQSVDEFLNAHEKEIKQLLSQNILNLAKGLTDENQAVSSSKGYIEALFLKVFDHLTTHIHSIEDPKGEHFQEEFLVKTALSLLNIVNKHFCKINAIRRAHGKATVNRIDAETMIRDYGDELHPAIPKEFKAERKIIQQAQKLIDAERRKISQTRRPERIEASRKKIKEAQAQLNQAKAKIDDYRLKNHFVPFVNDLLKVLNLENPEDLPMPAPVWKAFCQEVVPKLVLEMFDEISNPSRRNQFLLIALESFEEALDSTPCDIEEEVKYEDGTQKDLDTACGELVLQLLQMVPIRLLPEAITKVIFRLTKVKDISGEKIGRALRTKLKDQWSAIKILDESMAQGMTSLYPGHWDEEMHFIPTKTTMDKEGHAVEESGVWQHNFPMSEKEKEIRDQIQWEKDQALAQSLKKKMIRVPQKAIAFNLKSFVTSPWNRFHKSANEFISKHLGFTPLIAKQFCDYVCHKIFFSFLGGILHILAFPLTQTVSLIAELYLNLKLRHVYQTVQMDIHQNLFYQLGDGLKDALVLHQQDPTKDLITQLVETAIRRHETFPNNQPNL